MKLLFLLILFIPLSIFAKQICLAPSGCSIEMDTGLCPNCIEVDEQPIIKEEKVVVVHKPIVKIPPKKKPSQLVFQSKPKINCSQKWECIVPPCDFIDANGCLIE